MSYSKKVVLFSLLALVITGIFIGTVSADSYIDSHTEPTGPATVAPGEIVDFTFTVSFTEHSFFAGPGTIFTIDQSISIPNGWSYVGFSATHSGLGDVSSEFEVSFDPAPPATATSVQISETDDVLTTFGVTTVVIQLQASTTEGANWMSGATGHLSDQNSFILVPWDGFACSVVASRSVEIESAPTSSNIPSGASTTYDITVRNTGNIEDTYDLGITGTGYTSDLVTPQTIAANGGEYTYTMTYTDPGNAPGASIGGTATVTSQTDGGVTDTASITTNIRDYDVTVTVDPSEKYFGAGGTAVFDVDVENTGDIADTYDFTVTAPWTSTAVDGQTLNPGEVYEFTVQTTDQGQAPDQNFVATVSAISQTPSGPTGTDTATARLRDYAVTVTPNPSPVSILTGNDAVHTLTITNTGGIEDDIDLAYTGDLTPALSETSVLLAGGASTQVTLTYTNPPSGTYTGTVTATFQDVAVSGTSTINTKVATYGVTIVPDMTTDTVLTGSNTVYTFTVTNTGSHEDAFTLASTGGGTISGPNPLTVAVGSPETFTLTHPVPIADGVHTTTVSATSTMDVAATKASATSDLTTNVNRYGVTVTGPVAAQDFLKDTTKTVEFDVENTGNVQDTFTLAWTGDPAGTVSAPSITLAAGASDVVSVVLSGATPGNGLTGTLTATSQGAPTLGDTQVGTDTVTSNILDYAFTSNMLFSGRRFVEVDDTTSHPFDFTSNTNQLAAAYTVATTWGTANPAALTQASGGFALDIGAGDTATAGTYDGVVTVTSVEDPRETTEFTTRTWVTDPANHATENGATTGILDHSGTLGLTVDIATGGTHNLDLWKLTENPNDKRPDDIPLYYGGFVINDRTGLTNFHVTVEIPDDSLGGIDVSTIDAYLLTPCGNWYSATSGDFNYDGDVDQADFSIIAANWNSYGSDYVVFAIAGEEEFIPPVGPPAPVVPPTPDVPDVEVPEEATPEEAGELIGDAILDVITEDTTTEVIADIIEAETADSTTEEVAEVILTVVETSTTEETAEIVADVVADLEVTEAVEIVEAVVEEATVAEIATVVAEVVAERPVEEAAEIVADIVADNTVEEAAEVILEVIEERPVEEQAEILVEQQAEQAAAVVEELEIEAAVDIVEEAVQAGTTEEIAEVVNEVEPEVVAEVLLDSDPQLAAEVVNKMAADDLNSAAIRVEEAVKKKVGTVDATKSAEYEAQIDGIVTASLTETEKAQALVDLFIEIANLPNTPSTVAEVFEIIGLEKTMEVVSIWVEKAAYSELAKVYSYLTTETLAEVYTAMTTAARTAVFPYFDAATLGNLPELTTFTVDVDSSPATVETGEAVTVTATITNTGDEIGDIRVTMTEGSTEESEVLTLDAGASETLTWTITKATAGTYTVDVNGETTSWTVEAPPTPAAFETSNLAVTPATIMAGEDVTVTVDVENTGEESGSTTVSVELDGVEVDSEMVTLDGGASTTVSFTITSETEGAHTVEVDGESASFTVEEAPAAFPWTYVLIGIVVIAAAAYLYTQQQKTEE